MSLNSTQINSLAPTALFAIASYKLGYVTLQSGMTLEQFAASLCGIIEDVLRRLLHPFVEEGNRPEPRTVICEDGETLVSEGDLVAAAVTNAGLAETDFASTEEALRACCEVWF